MRSAAVGLHVILLVVWSTMMLGLYVIFGLVLPAKTPIDEVAFQGLIGTMKVVLGVVLTLIWLLFWRKLTDVYFQRIIGIRLKKDEEV